MTREDSLQSLQDELGILARRLRRVLGAQPGAHVVLTQVAHQGPVRAADLCAAIGIDKAAVSRQVQHLLELGLVEAAPDPDDGRATLLSITATGRRRLAEFAAERRGHLDERLSDWKVDELSTFVAALSRYNRALD